MGRIAIWLTGILLLSLIYAAAIYFRLDTIEYDLKERTTIALIKNNLEWAKVAIDGRDVVLDGMAPDEASRLNAEQALLSVWGVRAVKNRSVVNTITDKVAQPPLPVEKFKIPPSPEKQEVDLPQPVLTSAANEKSIDPATQCQQNIDEVLKTHSIEFDTGSSSIAPESNVLLDNLINAIKTCPQSRVEVAGHTDNVGDPDKNNALSLDRAHAVLDYLQQAGIKRIRLNAVGYGSAVPIDSNDTAEGRKRNRRIELHIK